MRRIVSDINRNTFGTSVFVGCHKTQNAQFLLLTYSIYFSYAIFLIDYKEIFKIAVGVKQLTVPLLPDPNCSMPENDAHCVIPVKIFLSK